MLPDPASRRPVHQQRNILCCGYLRDAGLWL